MEQQTSITIINRNPVRSVNKAFYLWSYIGGMILASLLAIPAFALTLYAAFSMDRSGIESAQGYILLTAAIVLILLAASVYVIVISCIITYKAWAAIQDGHARTTPGKAVGFQFIPFFGLYWIFQAYWGYAKDYNSYLARYNLTTKRLTEGIFLASCILALVSIVPYLGYLAGLGSMVIDGFVINEFCDGINRLADSSTTPV